MDFGEQSVETDQFQKQKMRNDCVVTVLLSVFQWSCLESCEPMGTGQIFHFASYVFHDL